MWEYFQDESYYGMWAVRHTSDKSLTSTVHVLAEDEAKFLVEKLNELQEKCGEINAGGSCKCTSGDTRRQEAPVEPLVTCHNCGSTAGYYSLGKACKKCHCVA